MTATSSSTAQNLESTSSSLQGNSGIQIPLYKRWEESPPAAVNLNVHFSRETQGGAGEVMFSQRTSEQALLFDGTLEIPWLTPIDNWAGAKLLSTRIGAGHASNSGQAGSQTRNFTLLWMPLDRLNIQARLERGEIPPPPTFYPVTVNDQVTVSDLRRPTANTSVVTVVSGIPAALKAALANTQAINLDWSPLQKSSLHFGVGYTAQTLINPLRTFAVQDVIDNEAALPGLVTRLPPSAADIATGEPGPITEVDVTPFTSGDLKTRSLDLSVQWLNAQTRVGTLTVFANGHRALTNRDELLPGVSVARLGEIDAPPNWTFTGRGVWARGNWHATAAFQYTGTGEYGGRPYDPYTTLDLSLGYDIRGAWAGIPHLQLGFAVLNVTDASPPWTDTILGFTSGSPLGRTFEVTLRTNFGGSGP